MDIGLLGWCSEGFRCPDVKVDLVDGAFPSKVSLVQMPNGTGKTTMLNLLRATMSGVATSWDSSKIQDYKNIYDYSEKGVFTVFLQVDGQPLTFELTLNFEDGAARYVTTSPGSGGIKKGWAPPPSVHRFLTPNFVDLFIFDGEFADRLLKDEYSEAEKAIDSLCQLYLLEEIKDEATLVWEKATQNKSTKTKQGLNKIKKRHAKIVKRINEISKARKQAKRDIRELESEATELKKKIDESIGKTSKLREKYDSTKEEEHQLEKDIELSLQGVMGLIRQPQVLTNQFCADLKELKHQLDVLKLPESTSKQFFTELLTEEVCICGRPMTEAAKAEIGKKSKAYLGDEVSGFLNALKADIDMMVLEDDPSSPNLEELIEDLDSSLLEKGKIESLLRALWDQLIKDGDDQLKLYEKKYEEIGLKIEELKEFVALVDADSEEYDRIDTFCLKSLRKMEREAARKISEITGTIDVKARVDTLISIVDKSLAKARELIRDDLTVTCNERLKTVLERNPLQIDSIKNSLKLKNQSGASVGQTLSVGYTFLTSLLHRGQHQFPLVVDSPANPLSNEVRKEIGKLIPSLCNQFVGLTISSERVGFVTSLESNAEKINYVTIFRKTDGTKALMPEVERHEHVESGNGVAVSGKDYYFMFDMDEE